MYDKMDELNLKLSGENMLNVGLFDIGEDGQLDIIWSSRQVKNQ